MLDMHCKHLSGLDNICGLKSVPSSLFNRRSTDSSITVAVVTSRLKGDIVHSMYLLYNLSICKKTK